MTTTRKLYYSAPYSLTTETGWLAGETADKIVLLDSPAYPEGGGQVGDSGTIAQGNIVIPFKDTQKIGVGRHIVRPDFPTITVEHQVALHLTEPVPAEFDLNKPIVVRVDSDRRRKLSRSHTAAHLLWLALGNRFGNLYPVVRGCYITENEGRFDLLIERPSEQDLRDAEGFIFEWVKAEHEIQISTLPDEPECRVWKSNGHSIPCGGTHLANTTEVGPVSLRVKSKGKSGFRVSYCLSGQ